MCQAASWLGLELCEGQVPSPSDSTLQRLGQSLRSTKGPGLVWRAVPLPGATGAWQGEARALGLDPGCCFPLVEREGHVSALSVPQCSWPSWPWACFQNMEGRAGRDPCLGSAATLFAEPTPWGA